MDHEQPHYSRKALSFKLSISISTLKRYEKKGILVANRIGPRLIRYNAEGLSDFLGGLPPSLPTEAQPALEPKSFPKKSKALKKRAPKNTSPVKKNRRKPVDSEDPPNQES